MKKILITVLLLLGVTANAQNYKFDFWFVEDVFYSFETEGYYIKYNDPSTFDYKELADICNKDSWPGEYILIEVDKALFREFLNTEKEYYYTNDKKKRASLSKAYSITEEVYCVGGGELKLVWRIRKTE